jgi:tetrapyrrole methylase family protein / MazG family protein
VGLIRIIGLGPGDPDLLTLGSCEALQAVKRVVLLLAPPELALFIESEGVTLLHGHITDPDLFVRGSQMAVDAFIEAFDGEDLAVGILGNPLSDFPGLPMLLRALEHHKIPVEIVPGMSRATLSAAVATPLLPLPSTQRDRHDFTALVEIMARLRRSCPWDRQQTHASLVPYLIEETHEVVDAIEGHNDNNLCEELGDLLLQIVFHAQLATERGKFSIADVIDTLSGKMIHRHPHVFGNQAVSGIGEVWENWEKLKALEPAAQTRLSKLDGIPKGLGALQRAQKMQVKAARVGFDWPNITDIQTKLIEEIGELEEARACADLQSIREEMGDVLFTLVNLARALSVDAEGALRDANEKFHRRFTCMERHAGEAGKLLNEMSLNELEHLWQLAKVEEAA